MQDAVTAETCSVSQDTLALGSARHQSLQQQELGSSAKSFANVQELHSTVESQQHGLGMSSLILVSLLPRRLWAFLRLGIPGGLQSSVESSAAEVTTALAGVLGTSPFT